MNIPDPVLLSHEPMKASLLINSYGILKYRLGINIWNMSSGRSYLRPIFIELLQDKAKMVGNSFSVSTI